MATEYTSEDLEALPDFCFGPSALGWWGTVAFMAIEGMGFALAIGCYFYLLPFEQHWPPGQAAPPLTWATITLVVALLSEIPNIWAEKRAMAFEKRPTQHGLVLVSVIGLVLIGLRAVEFQAFNVRWDANAFASVSWALLVMHMTHLVTDVYDSIVLAVMAYRRPMDGRKFSDVTDNALYWHFIVASWVITYVIVYWVPRWT